MLLRESLGNMNCRTTMIAHISAAAGNYAETLSTIQIASRVLRMKKKKTKVREGGKLCSCLVLGRVVQPQISFIGEALKCSFWQNQYP